ncbi:MAG: segregation/condensation protein A [Thermoleophilia bacterium]|nr:segregation/condensation protein A [Thermoleophilia bacterium]
MPVTPVRELPLDLEAFEGPFDLLLTLVLREELELVEVEIAAIVLAFCERVRSPHDLEACGEFLVLVASLLELKVRELFPEAPPAELEPEEAAQELAERLAEYRRFRAAAGWLAERLACEGERWFRIAPAPLAPPRAPPAVPPQEPARLAAALRRLAAEPPAPSLRHLGTFPPVAAFLERFRSLLRRRRSFVFDREVEGLSRVEQAVAFLAVLELRKAGEVTLAQPSPFQPIAVAPCNPA